jgi:hypothetical protein
MPDVWIIAAIDSGASFRVQLIAEIPSPQDRAGKATLNLEEGQQLGIDLILARGGEAVRSPRIDF